MHPGPRLLGYARVSTADQAANGHGLDAQEGAIREACERRNWISWPSTGTRDSPARP